MGRFSFMPPRSGTHWFRVGTVDVTTSVLIAGLASISLFVFALSPSLLAPFYLDAQLVLSGQVWRLVTSPFVNSPSLSSVIAIAMFWWFGQMLEQLVGRNRFLRMVIILAFVPAVVIVAIAGVAKYPFATAGMVDLAACIVVAFVAVYPSVRTFMLGIPLWVSVAVLFGVQTLSYIGYRQWFELLYLAVSVATALVTARSFGLTRIAWIPAIPLPAFVTGDRSRQQERKQRKAAHLRVVRNTDVNALLDKIAEHGINSLTKEERQRLDEHSRQKRDE